MNTENFRCFYAAGPAWGVYSQQTQDSSQAVRLEVSQGELPLRYVSLKCGVGSEKISVSNLRGPGNEPISAYKLNVSGANVQLDLGGPVTVPSGAALTFQLKRV
jgi:hypothetical protein